MFKQDAPFYNNNENLKKAGIVQEMTDTEKVEYLRCMDDIAYFCEKYVKVMSLDEGIVNFKMYDYQKRFIKAMKDNRFVISMQPRQSGKSVTSAAFILHQLVFNESYTVAILANKGDQAQEIMYRLQIMYENLPWFIQPGVKVWNKRRIELGNGSVCFTSATSGSAVRGRSINCVTGDTKVTWMDDSGNIFHSRIDQVPNINSPSAKNLKILTKDGFKDFDGVLCNGYKVVGYIEGYPTCTADHRFLVDGNWVYAKDMGWECYKRELVYDAINVADGNHYLTDGVTSHNCVLMDEYAHIDNAEVFFQSTFPTISSGKNTKVIIISTPNGLNHFYKMWSDAESGANAFVPVRVRWQEHPNRDNAWFEEMCRNMPPKQIAQEINCAFSGSSDTLISAYALGNMVGENYTLEREHLKVYEQPIEGHTYIGCIDTAEGVSLDYSVISVFDVSEKPYRLVAQWRNNETIPTEFAVVACQVLEKYNTALAIIESNNASGGIVSVELQELGYDNILTTAVSKAENNYSEKNNVEVGIRMTRRSKAIGCTYLKLLIESNTLLVKDQETIDELSTFILKYGSYKADRGKHDDCVMTLVLFAWFTAQDFFADYTADMQPNTEKQDDTHLLILNDDALDVYGFESDMFA